MVIHNIGQQNSIVGKFIAEIRDEEIQKDSMRFRRNLERMGEIFAYEISRTMNFKTVEVTTSLGVAEARVPSDIPVIATILRAGLPLHTGLLNYFDNAQNAFVSAYRKHHKNNTFEIALEYIACPDITDKTVILCDPMLASGSSMVLAYKALLQKGVPFHTHIVTAIASAEGLAYVKANMPSIHYSVWCAAIDEELTAQAYIVPGLGDAGDLAYGDKL